MNTSIFVINTFIVLFTTYLIIKTPSNYEWHYVCFMPALITSIYIDFMKRKMQYFLCDFCYFTILMTLYNFAIKNKELSNVLFIHSTGSLSLAVIIWNNKLVLHKMDKMASLYIHILPNILFYCSETNKLNFSDYLSAIGFYVGWQYFYITITEIVNKTELDNDKELSTSLRWMASNYKRNKMANTILYFCKKWGICNEFDSNDIKTKIIFITCQFIIMLLSLIVPFIISKAKEYHLVYIVIIFMVALYNGAV